MTATNFSKIVTSMVADDSIADMTWRQTAVLLITYHATGPVSVRELAPALNISKPAVTRSIDRLGSLGLIARGKGTEDGRLIVLQLTSKGRALSARLESMIPAAAAKKKKGN